MREQAVATNGRRHVLVFLCAVGMVLISILRGLVGHFQWIFDLGILGCLGGFLYLYVRYYLTTYVYELEGSQFRVYRRVGKKEQIACEVPLKNVMSVSRLGDPEYEKEGVVPKEFNYCASVGPQRPCVLVAYLDVDYIDRITIECSDSFFKLLSIRQQRYCTGEPQFRRNK
ncbi:MAG: hypothetical protein ACOX7F_08930 [Eubacteriales bacterium]|jgi:hypothetical protein